MIKKIWLVLVFALLCEISAKAQLLQIDSIDDKSFVGLGIAKDGHYIYTYAVTGKDDNRKKTATLEIVYGVGDFSVSGKLRTEISKTETVLQCVFTDEGICVVTIDAVQKTRTLLLLNMSGSIVQKQTTENVQVNVQANNIYLYQGMPDGCVLITPEEGKNGGYKITSYDRDLKVKWAKEYYGNSGRMDIVSAKMNMDNLVILRKELTDTKQQKYTYSIQTLMLHTDNMQQVTELKDEGDYCFPLFISNRDGMLATAGLYYKDGKYTEGKPSGIAYYKLGPDGVVMQKIKVPLQRLNQFLPDAVIVAMAKSTMLSILDVYFKPTGETIFVCELLEKQTGTNKQANLNIHDMMVIQLNAEGDVEKMQFVEKSPANNIVLNGIAAANNIQGTAEWLNKYRLFNYKFSTNMQGVVSLCYIGSDSAHLDMMAVLSPIDSPISDRSNMMLMSRLPDPNKFLKRKTKTVIDTDNNTEVTRASGRYADIFMINEQKAAIFNFTPPNIQVALEPFVKR